MRQLELRARNEAARAFYRRLSYREPGCIPGYYQGIEAAIRTVRDVSHPTAVRSRVQLSWPRPRLRPDRRLARRASKSTGRIVAVKPIPAHMG
ncbi:MAG: hypothetical protein WAU56_00785 [Steroidobacteraceae bacterium]